MVLPALASIHVEPDILRVVSELHRSAGLHQPDDILLLSWRQVFPYTWFNVFFHLAFRAVGVAAITVMGMTFFASN